ncbi:MAG: NAD(P)/FAD-dependent oxidoreductase [Fimbriimonadaceae bacterium]
MKKPVIVIGAGAAGIIASYKAALDGATVLLLEKTDRIGTKILISGGGKCNITHDGPINSVLKAFRKNEADFIRPSCFRYTNTDIINMLTERGLNVYTREDGRIFPVDQTAKDVARILHTYLQDANVHIKFKAPVTEILAPGEKVEAVRIDQETIPTNHVILCTGGSSFPKSGTTGDGYTWAKSFGHTIVPILAALAPVDLPLQNLQVKAGVPLRDIVLKARVHNKVIAQWRGDMLFTHTGLTGPCVLGITREISDYWHIEPAKLEVDLIPDLNFEQIQNRLIQFKNDRPGSQIRPFIEQKTTRGIVPLLLKTADVNEEEINQHITKKQINILTQTLKAWQLGPVKEVLLDRGEVVAGGVSLDEVDPHTMRSLKVQGLYLAGEVLDIAGPVGGYNLQAAWSTGFVAGETAAADWESNTEDHQ